MITIITNTQREYNNMMDLATNYMCRRLPFVSCGEYPPGHCRDCYRDHHIGCGIRVIEPVDNPEQNKL